MLFPFLVILPGMIALVLARATARRRPGHHAGQAGRDGAPLLDAAGRVVLDYDLATPMMLVRLLPHRHARPRAHRAAGVASCRAWRATSPPSTRVWTYDIYQSLHPARRVATRTTCGWAGSPPSVGIAARGGRGLRGGRVQQHHGPAAAGLRLRERAAVRHLPARHVLAPHAPATARSSACVAGTLGAAIHHGLTLPAGVGPGRQGRLLRRCCTPTRASWRRPSGPRSSPGSPASSSRSW